MLIILCNIISQIIKTQVGRKDWTSLINSNPDQPESQKENPVLQIDQQAGNKKGNSNNELEFKTEAPMPVLRAYRTQQDELR